MRPTERAILKEFSKLPQMETGKTITWLELRAVQSLERAADYLFFAGDQWEHGEQAAARDDAIALLRSRIGHILGREA